MASLLPYLKRLEIVEVEESDTPTTVNNYLPIKEFVEIVDRNGDPWEPVPGPDPWDDLVVSSGANYIAENVYEIGQVVNAKTATYTGGNPETTTYRSRWQLRRTSSDGWENSNWMDTTNEKNDHSYLITKPGQLRFQSQAIDGSEDPAVISSTSIKDVPFTEIGTVTIDPDSTASAVMGNQTFTAVVTGGDATDLAYKWTVRSGNAQLDTPDNQASATYTFIRDGQTQIQCAVSSANSSNSPQSNIAFVLVNA